MNQVVLQEAGAKALQYTTTEGYYPLREWIAKRMNERLGTSFDKDNILITHGSQQGLDLSGKVFLDDGDIVLCESPTYLAAISAFKSYGSSFIEIPTDEELIAMINKVEGVKSLEDLGFDESYQAETARLSPYVRARITFMRLLKFYDFYEEVISC